MSDRRNLAHECSGVELPIPPEAAALLDELQTAVRTQPMSPPQLAEVQRAIAQFSHLSPQIPSRGSADAYDDAYRDTVYQDRYQDKAYDDHYADTPSYRDGTR